MRDIRLTQGEYSTLITGRMNSMNGVINMIKAYNKLTDEQKEKSANGPFSIDSTNWRAAYSVTHPGTIEEMQEELLALCEGYVKQVRENYNNVSVK